MTPPDDYPFAPILDGLIEAQRQALPIGREERDWPEPVQVAAHAILRESAHEIFSQCLYLEFALFRKRMTERGDADGIYRRFCENVLGRDRAPFLDKYSLCLPTFLSAAGQRLDRFHRAVARLSDNRAAIEARFGIVREAPLQAVAPSLSDYHKGGASVVRFDFRGGQSLYYKPRGQKAETDLYEILPSINALGEDLNLRLPRVHDCGGFGFAEAIVNESCEDLAELRAAYFQSGAIGALLYLIGASDMHNDNVVGTRGGSVPVDLETLSAFRMSTLVPELADAVSHFTLHDTLFLPRWQVAGETCFQESAIANFPPGHFALPGTHWRDKNSDRMRIETGSLALTRAKNLLLLDGGFRPAKDFLEDFERGFRTAMRAIKHSPKIAQALVEASRLWQPRILLRNTQDYALLLQGAVHPKTMLSEENLTEYLTANLSQGLYSDPLLKDLVDLERAQLRNRDIPLFQWGCGPGAEALRRLFPLPPPERTACLLAKPEADEDYQAFLIRSAFKESPHLHFEPDCRAPPAGRAEALGALKRLGDFFLTSQMTLEDLPTWYVPRLEQPAAPDAVGFGLSDTLCFENGSLGILYFLAKLARLTGDERYLEPLGRFAESFSLERLEGRDASRFNGLAGIAFGLRQLGLLLEERRFLDWAREIVASEAYAVAAEGELDFAGGAAGAHLSRYLCGAPRDRLAAELADLAARLDARQIARCGFGHGSPGILATLVFMNRDLAFMQRGEILRLRDSILSAHGFDRLDDPAGRAAALTRGSLNSWCNGAAGSLLGVLLADSLLGIRDVRFRGLLADGKRILLTRQASDLCCGRFGHYLTLLTLTRHYGLSEERALLTGQMLGDFVSYVERKMEQGAFLRSGFTAGEGGMGALAIDALNGQDCARTMFLGG